MSDQEEICKPLEDTPIKKEILNDESLRTLEKLERASPELWPEKIPGMSGFMSVNNTPASTSAPSWSRGLSQDDINAMHQLGVLSVNGLAQEIRKVYDRAYQLGAVEAREMTRGKYLGIFENCPKKEN